jgi:hypothetical protein
MGTVTRHPAHLLHAGLALGILGVLLAGCNLFKPASPEIGGSGATLLTDYSLPDSCLRYMQVGIERKDNAGQVAYIGALADSTRDGVGFHAFFDLAVWNAYKGAGGTPPADWDLQHESDQFFPTFIRLYSDPYEMKWLPDEFNPHDVDNGDSRILHRRYEVRAVRQSTADTLLIAVGYADLYFSRISASRWALTRWEDRVAPDVGVQPADPVQQTIGSRRLRASS